MLRKQRTWISKDRNQVVFWDVRCSLLFPVLPSCPSVCGDGHAARDGGTGVWLMLPGHHLSFQQWPVPLSNFSSCWLRHREVETWCASGHAEFAFFCKPFSETSVGRAADAGLKPPFGAAERDQPVQCLVGGHLLVWFLPPVQPTGLWNADGEGSYKPTCEFLVDFTLGTPGSLLWCPAAAEEVLCTGFSYFLLVALNLNLKYPV